MLRRVHVADWGIDILANLRFRPWFGHVLGLRKFVGSMQLGVYVYIYMYVCKYD